MAAQQFLSPSVQDYAKAVYALETRGGAAVSTNDLAARLGVTPASVSGMVHKLTEVGIVEHEPYHGVRLTERGSASGVGGAAPSPPAGAVPRPGARDVLGSRTRRGRGARARALRGARDADRRAARRPVGRPARRSDPHARVRDRRAPDVAAWTSCRSVPRAASFACRTPTRRCCATSPSMASRSTLGSRSWTASRSVDRCSYGSASASIRSAASSPARCGSRPSRDAR